MPDNAIFYHLAYAIATGTYVLYAAVLVVRWNRVKVSRHPGSEE